MSIINVAQGGTAMLGAAAANAAANAVKGLPSGGAKTAINAANHSRELMLAGALLLSGAAILARGGRGTKLSAGDSLDE